MFANGYDQSDQMLIELHNFHKLIPYKNMPFLPVTNQFGLMFNLAKPSINFVGDSSPDEIGKQEPEKSNKAMYDKIMTNIFKDESIILNQL